MARKKMVLINESSGSSSDSKFNPISEPVIVQEDEELEESTEAQLQPRPLKKTPAKKPPSKPTATPGIKKWKQPAASVAICEPGASQAKKKTSDRSKGKEPMVELSKEEKRVREMLEEEAEDLDVAPPRPKREPKRKLSQLPVEKRLGAFLEKLSKKPFLAGKSIPKNEFFG